MLLLGLTTYVANHRNRSWGAKASNQSNHHLSVLLCLLPLLGKNHLNLLERGYRGTAARLGKLFRNPVTKEGDRYRGEELNWR